MSSCQMCGSPVPDGQDVCSMCYGDVGYGSDGYYGGFLLEQARDEYYKHLEDEYYIQLEEEHMLYKDTQEE